MKVKKKWKKYVHQIALACLLICCIVQWLPEKVFASTLSLEYYELNEDGTIKVENNNNVHTVSQIQTPGADCRMYTLYRYDNGGHLWSNYIVTSAEKVKITAVSDDGSTRSYPITSYMASFFDMAGTKLYIYPYISWSGGYFKFHADSISTLYLTDDILKKYKTFSDCAYDYIMHCYGFDNGGTIFDGHSYEGGDSDSIDSEKTKGQIDNPIEDDEEIGIPVITKRRYTTVYHDTDTGNASDGKEDIDDSQFIFDWSNKTSTGFNLKKNKYHMTRIQIKVQSKCVVYSGFSHKTVKKRFDNYGEMSSEIKSALADDTPYSIEYGTVKSMLPKTFSEKHNPLYVGRNFTFYFRVMCNESASGTGKWHCGAWRAVGLNASTTQDQTDESSNGHIDSDGNYTKDPDDGHNNSDSDSSTVDDKEDAKDQFKDDQKNGVTNGKNDSSGFEWSDLKKLVNECKEVPALIKSIFSFLPDWVLVFVAVGFGIWIFVLIKRAIV